MVKKLTMLELHLDDARFTNAVPGLSDVVDDATGGDDATDADAATGGDSALEDASVDAADESTGGRGFGRRIGMLAVALGLAVGVRMALRRVRSGDGDVEADEILEDASVSVDVDERVDA